VDEVAAIREEAIAAQNNEQLLAEHLADLEREIVGDEGWRRLVLTQNMDFTRDGLNRLIEVSRAMYLHHPLIQRAVNVNTYYTWAQGHQFKAKDQRIQDEVVDVTTDDERNRLALYSHQATILTDVDQMVEGNIHLALFTNGDGDIQVRSIPTEQIWEIICDPQDMIQVRFYRRCWTQVEFNETTGNMDQKQYEELYPDINYQPRVKPESIAGVPVNWDSPIIHQRTGGFKHMQFGIPQTYAALDWARAYKKFLEDWHTVVASLARFAWKTTAKGSKAQRLKDRMRRRGTQLEEPSEGEQQGPPIAGAMWADSADLTPIGKSGAVTTASDAKQSRLMVGAAMDLPDTILSGDPQQGNLATATTLDRPTELGMRNRQSMYNDLHARIFRYIVDAKVRRGKLPGRVIRTPEGSVVDPRRDPQVLTIFPPILEHNPKDQVAAVVAAATLSGKPKAFTIPREELSRQLMAAVGVADIDQALKDLEGEEEEELRKAAKRAQDLIAQQGNGNGAGPDPDEEPAPAPGNEA